MMPLLPLNYQTGVTRYVLHVHDEVHVYVDSDVDVYGVVNCDVHADADAVVSVHVHVGADLHIDVSIVMLLIITILSLLVS